MIEFDVRKKESEMDEFLTNRFLGISSHENNSHETTSHENPSHPVELPVFAYTRFNWPPSHGVKAPYDMIDDYVEYCSNDNSPVHITSLGILSAASIRAPHKAADPAVGLSALFTTSQEECIVPQSAGISNDNGPVNILEHRISAFAGKLTTYEEVLGKVKPMNTIIHLYELLNSPSIMQSAVKLTLLAEMHEFYWGTNFTELALVCLPFLKALFSKIGDSFLFLRQLFYKTQTVATEPTTAPVPQSFEITEDGLLARLNDFLLHIGIDVGAIAGVPSLVALISCAATALAILFTGLSLDKALFGVGFFQVLHKVATVLKDKTEIMKSMNDVMALLSDAFGTFIGFTWKDEESTLRVELFEQMLEFETQLKLEVEQIALNFTKILRQPDKFVMYKRKMQEWSNIVEKFSTPKQNLASLNHQIKKVQAVVDVYESRFLELRRSTATKQQPTVIWLSGKPGMGKSHFATNLLIPALNKIEGMQLGVYVKKNEKYWSGYVGQDVVIFDDFNNVVESSDLNDLLDIYTPTASTVSMAAVEDKGRFFCSRYLIICSNKGYIEHSQKLETPSCMNRRRDFFYEVSSDYTCEQLRKTPALYARNKFTPMKITKEDTAPLNPPVTGDPASFLAKLMFDHQETNYKAFQAKMDEINKMINPVLAQGPAFAVRPNLESNLFLLIGPPRIGKTDIAKEFRRDLTQDDFPTHAPEWEDKVLQLADASSDERVVLTANPDDYAEFFKGRSEARERFERRLTIYVATFRKKNFFRTYSRDDLEDGVSVDTILDWRKNGIVPTTRVQLQSHIRETYKKTQNERPIIDCLEAPLISLPCGVIKVNVAADFIELQNITPYNAFSKCTVTGASFAECIVNFTKMFGSLSMAQRSEIADLSPDQSLMYVNSLHLRIDNFVPVLITCQDYAFYCTTYEDILYLCKVDEVSYTFSDDQLHCSTRYENWTIRKGPVYNLYKGILNFREPIVAKVVEEVSTLNTICQVLQTFVKTAWAGVVISSSVHKDSHIERESDPYDYDVGPSKPGPKLIDYKIDPFGGLPWDKAFSGGKLSEWRSATGFNWADEESKRREAIAEAWTDEASAQLTSKIIKQTFSLQNLTGQHLCYAICVRDNELVTVAHTFNANTNLYVVRNQKRFKVASAICDNFRDLAIFKIEDKTWQPCSDLTVHLQLDKGLTKNGIQANLTLLRDNRPRDTYVILKERTSVSYQGSTAMHTVLPYTRSIDYTPTFPLQTTAGDCGSPCVIVNSSIQRKFLGFHCAATANQGYFVQLFASDFAVKPESSETIKILKFQEVVTERKGVNYYNTTPVDQHISKGFTVIGLQGVDEDNLYYGTKPTLTQLYRSPFSAGAPVPDLFEPAVLSSKDERLIKAPEGFDPYSDNINKWDKVRPTPDASLLSECVDTIANDFAQIAKKTLIPIKVLTSKEAINGYSALETSHPLVRKSSPGYPYNSNPSYTLLDTKSQMFFTMGPDGLWSYEHQLGVGEKLHSHVNNFIENCKQGQVSAVVFNASLKDEVVKLPKVEVGKSRSFAGSPLYFTIAMRKYTHASGAMLAYIRDQIPAKVGMNPASIEWGSLYKYLTRNGSSRGFDADYKAYDASLPAELIQACAQVHNKLYQSCDPNWKEEDDIVRNTLYKHLSKPLLTFYDKVVRAEGGHVSGQPNTSIDNCIMNILIYYYIYLKIMREKNPKLANYKAFKENVAFAVSGDDNLCTITESIEDIFNIDSFTEQASMLGLEITTALKDGGVSTKTVLNEMTFLKRRFIQYRGNIIGPLEDEAFSKILHWCKRNRRHVFKRGEDCAYDPTTIASTLDSCLLEAALKGKKFYDAMVAHLEQCVVKHGIVASEFLTFEDQFNRVYWNSVRNVSPEGLTSRLTYDDKYKRYIYKATNACVAVKGQMHQHECPACGSVYQHEHGRFTPFHPQFLGDCPVCQVAGLLSKSKGKLVRFASTSDVSSRIESVEAQSMENTEKPQPKDTAEQTPSVEQLRRENILLYEKMLNIESRLAEVSKHFVITEWEAEPQSAPPTPVGGAGGVTFSSTEAVVLPVSQTEAPGAGPTESVAHATTVNIIDSFFYEQFVPLTNFTWATSQAPGTMLWTTPITPLRGHANLAYITKMYNIWTGSLEYSLKVAGTGFHAGALAMVKTPPNVDPNKLTSANLFGYYPYVVIDPKTLECTMKAGHDQRNVMYHYLSEPLTNTSAIGGHLSIFVLQALNTSSTGTAQINVQVFNRVGPDFMLLQMMPVDINDDPVVGSDYDELLDYKPLHRLVYDADNYCDRLVILAATTTSSSNTNGLVSVHLGTNYDGDMIPLEYIVQGKLSAAPAGNIVVDAFYETRLTWTGNEYVAFNCPVQTDATPSGQFYVVSNNNDYAFTMSSTSQIDFSTGGSGVTFAVKNATGVPTTSGQLFEVMPVRPLYNPTAGAKPIIPGVNESIVSFSCWDTRRQYYLTYKDALPTVAGTTRSKAYSYSLTTRFINQFIKEHPVPLGDHDAMLFQLVSKSALQPVCYIKLYRQGYFTAAARAVETSFKFFDVGVKFIGYIRDTDPIPS